MENKNTFDIRPYLKKYDSVEASIAGPEEANNDDKTQYYVAKFAVNVMEDDGYISQSRAETKVFFENSHSLIFAACAKCVETEKPLKILAGRVVIPTGRPFFILNKDGEKQLKNEKKADSGYRTAEDVVLFLIADESVRTSYNRRINQITQQNAWVPKVESDDDAPSSEDISADDLAAE